MIGHSSVCIVFWFASGAFHLLDDLTEVNMSRRMPFSASRALLLSSLVMWAVFLLGQSTTLAGESIALPEKQLTTVTLDSLSVTGATRLPGTDNYTVAQSAGANVTVTAVLKPDKSPSSLPADTVTWTGGTAGSNQLERLVSRAAPADVTVTATMATVSRSVRIVIRRACDANAVTRPTQNPTVDHNAARNRCRPNAPALTWHVCSDGDKWVVRVDTLTCTGIIDCRPWPSRPNQMVVPNTANPGDVKADPPNGNINNTAGSRNRWTNAVDDMADYHSAGGGAGPRWHSTEASQAHEHFHWDTDWMTTSLGVAPGGDWAATEIALENLSVSVLDQLTEASARTALEPQVDARFRQFSTTASACWTAIPDTPGVAGSGGYVRGMAILQGLINNVETYRTARGWAR